MEDVSQATEGVQKPKEEKETAEKTEEKPKVSPPPERKETFSIIDRANETAKRLEKANRETQELLDKQERLMANQMLAGQSFAGAVNIEKEEDPIEYSKRLERGEVNPFAEDAK